MSRDNGLRGQFGVMRQVVLVLRGEMVYLGKAVQFFLLRKDIIILLVTILKDIAPNIYKHT